EDSRLFAQIMHLRRKIKGTGDNRTFTITRLLVLYTKIKSFDTSFAFWLECGLVVWGRNPT
ncbi:hypothetical protein, partial [Bacillus sp. C30]|uniref:hypothetical protein n=1 Tax=Bacillus sp. C30 TaxID=1387733 RepID=UPI00349FB3C6